MKKIVIVDIDGVLLNWYDAFLEYTNLTKEEFITLEKEASVVATDLVRNFNKSAACGFLRPMGDDCIWGMNKLFENGYEIHSISAFGGDKYSKRLRIENLAKYFSWKTGLPLIRDIKFCDIGESKKRRLLRYGKNSGIPYIEDHLRHARKGAELGFTPFLLNRSYNSSKGKTPNQYDDSIFRVDNWKQIIAELI